MFSIHSNIQIFIDDAAKYSDDILTSSQFDG